MLPVEAQTRTRAPSSIALATATTMPRSLKEPVGFRPSYLKKSRRRPSDGPMLRLGTSGVEPSSSETSGVASVTGSQSR